jgi:hypothetical protein
MKRINILILAMTLSVPAFSQARSSAPKSTSAPPATPKPAAVNVNVDLIKTIEDLKKKVEALETEIKKLQESSDFLSSSVYGSNSSNGLIQRLSAVEDRYLTVELDPASPKKFSRIDTTSGILYVVLEDTSPYLDGYKVKLKIGNPMYTTFQGITMNVTWGPKWDSSKKFVLAEYNKWKADQQKKEFTFTEILSSGAWSPIEIILPKTTPAQMGLVTILSIHADTASLR